MDQRHAVLVVDDDPSIRELLAAYLSERECTVLSAANCAEARELVASRPCAVALLDIGLPGEDGLSFARYLRECHDIGIIILSGLALLIILRRRRRRINGATKKDGSRDA